MLDTRVLAARPRVVILLGLVLFGAVWLAELHWSALTPPFDNLEQLTWAQSLQAGYYKHPPLPTWIVWLPAQLMGGSAWSSYLLGAACTLLSLFLLWQLLAAVRGPRHATVALLASLCVTYYTSRLNYYNHDVVLLLVHTVCAALCWRAVGSGGPRWWIALGAALGLGALTKYQVSVTAVCVIAYWLLRGGWRDAAQRRGLLLAALVATATFAPHAWWLHANGYQPVHYAMSSSLAAHLDPGQRPVRALHWLIEQLFNRAMPAWILLAVAALTERSRRAGADTAPGPFSARDRRFRVLLLCWAVVPLLFMPLTGLLFGAHLHKHWGLPFLLFAVPAAMDLLMPRVGWARVPLRSVVVAFVLLQVAMLAINAACSPRGPWNDRRQERSFDAAAIAQRLQEPARRALGGRICVVSGPHIPTAALAQALDDKPRLLVDGRYDYSPWVEPGLAQRCGLLEISLGAARAGWTTIDVPAPQQQLQWRAVPPSEGVGDP